MYDYVLNTILLYIKIIYYHFKILQINKKISKIFLWYLSIIENYDIMGRHLILINIKMAVALNLRSCPHFFQL